MARKKTNNRFAFSPDPQAGGVVSGGVPQVLLAQCTQYEVKACTLLYNLHKYLLSEKITVDRGFQFGSKEELSRFKNFFWAPGGHRKEWMSASFKGFKSQLSRCKFGHDDNGDPLTWTHPRFTYDDPDILGILEDKKGGDTNAPVAEPEHHVPAAEPEHHVPAAEPEHHVPAAGPEHHVPAAEPSSSREETRVQLPSTLVSGLSEKVIECMLIKGIQRWAPDLRRKCGKTVVQYSCPSVGAPLNVDELRSTIIGEAIAHMLEFCGVDVSRVNHVMDLGNRVGCLIEYLVRTVPQWRSADTETIGDIQEFVKAARAMYRESSDFKEKVLEVMSLRERGDPMYSDAWAKIRELSLTGFERIYARLGVSPKVVAASFYGPHVSPVLEDLCYKELIVDGVDEEWLIMDEVRNRVRAIVEGDGSQTVFGTYLTALFYRLRVMMAEWIIYVHKDSHKSFFESVFSAARVADWLPTETSKPKATHVGFSTFKGPSDVVGILDRVVAECNEMLAGQARREEWSTTELQQLSETFGYGALKYEILRTDGDEFLSLDQMLNAQDSFAVQLQHVLGRIHEMTKPYKCVNDLRSKDIKLSKPEECSLGLHLVKFTGVVEKASLNLKPHLICEYLHGLSVEFTDFVEACPIDPGSYEEFSRVLLCEATGDVLSQCLLLLGIGPAQDVRQTQFD